MRPVRRFRPGVDAIGVFSPSDTIAGFPRRTQRGAQALAHLTGSEIVFAPNALGQNGRLSGSAEERLADLKALLIDPRIGLIMGTTGGYNSLDVAVRLEPELFAHHAKPIVGFSDTTFLLNDINRSTGHVTFHGPALLPNFGRAQPDKWQANALLRLVAGSTAGLELSEPDWLDTEFQFWDRDDDQLPEVAATPSRRSAGRGIAEGTLIGGNLDTLVALGAADRLPSFEGAIVFLEAAFCSIEKVSRDIGILEQRGLFSRASGVIIGLPFRVSDDDGLWPLARELAGRYNLPLLYGASIGHTCPIHVLPIGAPVRLDPSADCMTLLAEVTL